MSGPRILFLLPVVSQVRFRKRISALQRLGAAPSVLAFERDYYAGAPEEGYVSLGGIHHGSYPSRLVRLGRSVRRVRAEAKSSSVVYCFGLDMLLLAWVATRGLLRCPRLVYEIGDIRKVQLAGGVVSSALRALERFLVGRAHVIVVTSESFKREYYQGMLGVRGDAFQVIENKLDPDFMRDVPAIAQSESEGLRIGYFGLLRCPRSWEILKLVAQRGAGRAHVYVRGLPMNPKTLPEEAGVTPHVDYGGAYLAPDELPLLYGNVDIVWACYPYEDGGARGNWKWARTNRFYEACYFGRPMVCQRGSADAEIVSALELGLSLDLTDAAAASERILAITCENIERWTRNILALPRSVYMHESEHQLLLEALTQ